MTLTIVGPARVSFAEQGTDTVATYRATDGQGQTVSSLTWSLVGADAGDFTGRGDTLRFLTAPDFEIPADNGGDSVYDVTVKAKGTGSEPDSSTHEVTVTVTNEEEPGSVDLSSTRPQVGTAVTATLDDPDSSVTNTLWQWQRQASATAAWTNLEGSSARLSEYTPVAAEAGQMLRATVGYRDGHGPGKSAQSAATDPVQADVVALTVSYEASTYRATEGGAAETVTVSLSAAADRLLKIPIKVTPDSGTESTDYAVTGLGTNDTLSFARGASARSFSIKANQDDDRDDERVTLSFGTLPSDVSAGTLASATVTLVDVPPPPPPPPSAAGPADEREGDRGELRWA